MWRILGLVILATGMLSTGVAGPASIQAVYPNPVAYNDAGEYLILEFRNATNLTGWVLDDGEGIAKLHDRTLSGNRTVTGRILVTLDPAAVNTTLPIVRLDGDLALANSGERIKLLRFGELIDTVSYDRAAEGETYRHTETGWTWRPPGRTDFRPTVSRDIPATVFVLPDAPTVIRRALQNGSERVLLAGYTFNSRWVTEHLCTLAQDGVRTEVLLEREPVGGLTAESAESLNRLTSCGVTVYLLGGPHARYRFHHPKYAVIDDRVLVMTENWKPSGIGGAANRGWGVILRNATIAESLMATFEADVDHRDTVRWRTARSSIETVDENGSANTSFPSRFHSRSLDAHRVELLAAPDNAETRLSQLIRSANRTVLIEQVSIDNLGVPLLQAALEAADRGVKVRILLSSAWYIKSDNRRLAEQLRNRANTQDLSLEVRLTKPRSRFAKLHVKGLIVDDTVIVGSANWNNVSLRENREVLVLLHDPEAAAYYADVFWADWRGGRWRLPLGFAGIAIGGIGCTGYLMHRRVRFAPDQAA